MIQCFYWLRLLVGVIFLAASAQSLAAATTVLSPIKSIGDAKRVALVIGNAGYTEVPGLKNTINDARSVAEALRLIGFTVHLVENADRRDMNESIGQFLANVEPGSEVVFFYSGHGVELEGSNYLLPTDIPRLEPGQDRLLRTEAISLANLLEDLSARSARVTLVILDACRDNPFAQTASRSLGRTRGLGRVEPPQGSFVIYAAGAGELALDSLGSGDTSSNGLFTRHFISLLHEEGLELRSMVRSLRSSVRSDALRHGGHSQTPSYYDQLIGDFYFVPHEPDEEAGYRCELLVKPGASIDDILLTDVTPIITVCQEALAATPQPGERLLQLLHIAEEQRAVQQAMFSPSPIVAQAFLRQYPQSRYREPIEQHLVAFSTPRMSHLDPSPPAAPLPQPAEPIEPFAVVAPAQNIAPLHAVPPGFLNADGEDSPSAPAREGQEASAGPRDELGKAVEAAPTDAAANRLSGESPPSLRLTSIDPADRPQQEYPSVVRVPPVGVSPLVDANSRFEPTPDRTAGVDPVNVREAVQVKADLIKAVQDELQRVGCRPGHSDGIWGGRSRGALQRFIERSGVRIVSLDPTTQVLEAVQSKKERVCAPAPAREPSVRASTARKAPANATSVRKAPAQVARIPSPARAAPAPAANRPPPTCRAETHAECRTRRIRQQIPGRMGFCRERLTICR